MHHINVIVLAIVCALLTTAGQIALKTGVSTPILSNLITTGDTSAFLIRAAATPLVLVGLVLYAASAVLWLLVLARADVSYAFPLVSLGFIFTAAYAHFALHEPLTAARLTGIAFITLGVAFVSRS